MGKRENFLTFFKQIFMVFTVFLAFFFFLHQKILYFVEAYELSAENREYTSLKEKKDSLLYAVSQKTAISQINGWRAENEFDVVKNDRVSVLYAPKETLSGKATLTQTLVNFVYKGAHVPNAFAQEYR